MSERLSDEAMKRIAEEGSAAAMLLLWQEASRARESETFLLGKLRDMVSLADLLRATQGGSLEKYLEVVGDVRVVIENAGRR